jgi:hypothetical protein
MGSGGRGGEQGCGERVVWRGWKRRAAGGGSGCHPGARARVINGAVCARGRGGGGQERPACLAPCSPREAAPFGNWANCSDAKPATTAPSCAGRNPRARPVRAQFEPRENQHLRRRGDNAAAPTASQRARGGMPRRRAAARGRPRRRPGARRALQGRREAPGLLGRAARARARRGRRASLAAAGLPRPAARRSQRGRVRRLCGGQARRRAGRQARR